MKTGFKNLSKFFRIFCCKKLLAGRVRRACFEDGLLS